MSDLSLSELRRALERHPNLEDVVSRADLLVLVTIAQAALMLTEAESSGIFDVRLGGLVDALKEVKK